jgi:hypothetical protein
MLAWLLPIAVIGAVAAGAHWLFRQRSVVEIEAARKRLRKFLSKRR